MRKFTSEKKILCPAPISCSTIFIALKNILTHEHDFRVMTTSKEGVSFTHAKEIKVKKFIESVLNTNFWQECVMIV